MENEPDGWKYMVLLKPDIYQPEVVDMIRGAIEVGHISAEIGLTAIVAYNRSIKRQPASAVINGGLHGTSGN